MALGSGFIMKEMQIVLVVEVRGKLSFSDVFSSDFLHNDDVIQC